MPPVPEQSAYEILNLPRTATQEEIKKRYRELARQLHPDVNQTNPAAARQFSQVSQAYKQVSDPDSRKVHDSELILREQRSRQAAAKYATPAPGASRQAATGRPVGTGSAASNTSESARLTGEARSAFLRDRPVEARALAEQAIRLNRRNADAWEVLGDVYRRQGRSEDAVNAYSMSLQINPRNPSVMHRLERMAQAAGPGSYARPGGPGASSAAPGTVAGGYSRADDGAFRAASGRMSRLDDPEKKPLRLLLTWVAGYGGVFLAILYAAMFPGDAPNGSVPILQWVSHWNATITTVLGICGFLLGATMTMSGAIRRIDDELILSGVAARGGSFLPLGLLMIVVSVVNFYAAAALYAIVTALQESFTTSMMRVFGAVTGVVVLLAVIYQPDHVQVLIFGGNVVFISFVIGWLLGDFFRADIG
jgi:curved DNA-binding protein CbpA